MASTVLIVDSRARAHVLSLAYEKSSHVKKIIVAPGNDFITYKREKEIIVESQCKLTDPISILQIAKKYKPDLVDVAQDDALAAGTVDLLIKEGFTTFGPKREAAKIEWDKAWARNLMNENKIPTPEFASFYSEKTALNYLEKIYAKKEKLVFVKASGLAAGKGALKATNLNEAKAAVRKMKTFGSSGKTFVIEEGLVGREFSHFSITDGKTFKTFKVAADHKRALNFDQGEQTGGMGAISPLNLIKGKEKQIEDTFIAPLVTGVNTRNIKYQGIIFLGGMVTKKGIKNIEYNARWGDPEAHVIVPGIKSDYFKLVETALTGKLKNYNLKEDSLHRVAVVGAAKGYPENYSEAIGKEIFGLEEAMKIPGVTILGSQIKIHNKKFYVAGGRLFSVVGTGKSLSQAREKAYQALAGIFIDGNNLHYRIDIGWQELP